MDKMPYAPLITMSVVLYLITLRVRWPQTPDDMPGGGWPAVYLRPALFVALVLGILGTTLAIATHS